MTALRLAGEGEIIPEGAPATARLLLDHEETEGALSSLEVTLGVGAAGAAPHFHKKSHELFYVVEGEVQILSGDDIMTVGAGGVVVVPKFTVHAFGAAPDSAAKLLIVLTPGVERFEYFRLLAKIESGLATVQDLMDSQDLYDNHFVASEAWQAERAKP